VSEQILIEFIGDSTQLEPAVNILEGLGQIDARAAESFRKSNAELQRKAAITRQVVQEEQRQIKTIKDLEKSVDQLSNAFIEGFQEGIVEALNEAGVSLEEFQKALKDNGLAVDEVSQKTGTFRKQIAASREALAEQLAAGKLTTAQLYEMARGASVLRDAVGDANATINTLASDTFAIDATIQGFQLMANTAQIAMGATALLGNENKDLQQILVKLNAVMAITQGLQTTINLLQKNSALLLGASVLKTNLLTKAQAAYNFVVNGGTVALKAFRAALVSTGIGAVVVALGFLIEKLLSTKQAQEDVNKELDRFKGLLDDELDLIDKYGALADQALQRRGAKESERIRNQGRVLVQTREAVEKAIIALEKKYPREWERTPEITAQIEELYKRRGKLDLEIAQKRIDLDRKVAEEFKEAEEKKRQQQEKTRQQAIINARALAEIELRRLQKDSDFFESVANNENEVYQIRLLALEAFLSKRTEAIKVQQRSELLETNLSEQQRLNIIDKYNVELEKLTEEGYALRNLIIRQYNEQLQKESDEFWKKQADEEAARIQGIIQRINADFEGIDLFNARELDEDLENLQTYFQKGIISLEQYEKRREAIINEYRRRELSNERSRLEALIAITGIGTKEREELERQLLQVKDQLRQLDLQNHKANEDEKTKKTKEEADKRRQAEQDAIRAAFDVARSIADAKFAVEEQRRRQQLDASLRQLDADRNRELANKDLTERQKELINERYARKEAELKRRAFIADQNAKAKQAMINGFLAATQALATLAPPMSFIAAAAALAAAGVQAAAIRNTPIPQFRKGTKSAPKGYAWVGEEGPELVYLNGGERIYTYNQSKKVEQAWDRGIMATPEQILNNVFQLPQVDQQLISQSYFSQYSAPIDYERLADAIARRIPEPKSINNVMDEDGIATFIISKNRKVQLKNKRYKL
jgi:hypothetical protein